MTLDYDDTILQPAGGLVGICRWTPRFLAIGTGTSQLTPGVVLYDSTGAEIPAEIEIQGGSVTVVNAPTPSDTNTPTPTETLTPTPTSLPPGTISIRASIDGRSRLIIQGNAIGWQHFDAAAPGREGVAPSGSNPILPTYVNGAEWYPDWPDVPDPENRDCGGCLSSILSPDPPLPPMANFVGMEETGYGCRGTCEVVEAPTAGNDFKLVVEFNDDPQPGSSWYENQCRDGADRHLLTHAYRYADANSNIHADRDAYANSNISAHGWPSRHRYHQNRLGWAHSLRRRCEPHHEPHLRGEQWQRQRLRHRRRQQHGSRHRSSRD